MKALLLDTSVFLWFVTRDPKLKPEPYDRISQFEGQVWLSIASTWEIAIKVGIGKLNLDRPLDDLLGEPLKERAIDLLEVSKADILAYSKLPILDSGHRDPFDRMLVVQAQNRALKLLTSDARFQKIFAS